MAQVTSRTFDAIYRDNLWNGTESRSGPGSGEAATRLLRHEIVRLVADLDIRSVLDIGCGDGYWMPDLPGYVGFDWSTEAIDRAAIRHPDRDYRTELYTDQRFDLVVVRDVVQHLDLYDGVETIKGAMRHASRFLLASTYVGGTNVDIVPGLDAYSPDLTQPPFDLPEPDRLIFDGHYYHDHDTDQVRDPSKHLGLWHIDRTVA